jgi:hypothetical protein
MNGRNGTLSVLLFSSINLHVNLKKVRHTVYTSDKIKFRINIQSYLNILHLIFAVLHLPLQAQKDGLPHENPVVINI